MFIEQLKKSHESLLKYLPFPIIFFGSMFFNFFVSQGTNSGVLIEMMIQKMGKNLTLLSLLLPFTFFLFFLLFWVKKIQKQSITSLTTSRPQVDFSRSIFSFGLWSIFLIAYALIAYFLFPEEYILSFNPKAFLGLLIIALIFIPIQTSFEEYFFRGYLMQGLGLLAKNKWVPFVVTSLIFGLMHLSNPEIGDLGYQMLIYYIGAGFFFGLLTLMDDGLELALGFHAANNLLGALLVSSKGTVFQTDAILESIAPSSINEIYIQVFLIFPIVIFIFAKKYNWSNWMEKLTGKV